MTTTLEQLENRIERVEAARLPFIGAIVAWAGPLPEPGDDWHKVWHVCDGSALDEVQFPALFKALGGGSIYGWEKGDFKLPDFRACFLRGEGSLTTDLGRYESGKAGTVQENATRLPENPFKATGGDHTHLTRGLRANGSSTGSNYPGVCDQSNGDKVSFPTIDAGTHSHLVTGGGDPETRPVNHTINWVIRIR